MAGEWGFWDALNGASKGAEQVTGQNPYSFDDANDPNASSSSGPNGALIPKDATGNPVSPFTYGGQQNQNTSANGPGGGVTSGGVAGGQRTHLANAQDFNTGSGAGLTVNGSGVIGEGALVGYNNGTFSYANQNAYNDPNANNIYSVINNQINNRANQQSPMASLLSLGQAAQYGGAKMGPVAAANGAQMSPQMMVDAAQMNTAQDMQYGGAQNALANQLYAQSQGQGPSVAEQTAKMQADQNTKSTMAMLGSQRGAGSAAQGLRMAANQSASAQQQAAQTAALGRSQEAMNAQNQLAGVLGGARGQPQQTAQTQAQLAQQALLSNQGAFNQAAQQQAQMAQQAGQFNAGAYNQQAAQQAQLMQQAGLANAQSVNQVLGMDQQTQLANLQAQLQQTQMNNQMYGTGLAAYMGQNQQDIANAIRYQEELGQEQQFLINPNMQKQQFDTQTGMQVAGAGMAAAGTLAAAFSDQRLKMSIRSGEGELKGLLAALAATEGK